MHKKIFKMSNETFGTDKFVEMAEFLKLSPSDQKLQWESAEDSPKGTDFLKKLSQNFNPVESNSRTTAQYPTLDDSMVFPQGMRHLNMSDKQHQMNISGIKLGGMFKDKPHSQVIGEMGLSQDFNRSQTKAFNFSRNEPFGHKVSMEYLDRESDFRNQVGMNDASTVKQQYSIGMERPIKNLPSLSKVNSSLSQGLFVSRSSRPSSKNVKSIR